MNRTRAGRLSNQDLEDLRAKVERLLSPCSCWWSTSELTA